MPEGEIQKSGLLIHFTCRIDQYSFRIDSLLVKHLVILSNRKPAGRRLESYSVTHNQDFHVSR